MHWLSGMNALLAIGGWDLAMGVRLQWKRGGDHERDHRGGCCASSSCLRSGSS